jgi:ArsR family transcriptional regulator
MSPHREISQVFQALSDPTRLEILARLSRSEACASEIHTALGMSQPRVARHLKILVATGLLEARRDGRFVRYAPARDARRSRLVRAVLGLLTERPASGPPDMASAPLPHAASASLAPATRTAATQSESPGEVEAPRPPMEDFLL